MRAVFLGPVRFFGFNVANPQNDSPNLVIARTNAYLEVLPALESNPTPALRVDFHHLEPLAFPDPKRLG